jgi:hypothetical protein
MYVCVHVCIYLRTTCHISTLNSNASVWSYYGSREHDTSDVWSYYGSREHDTSDVTMQVGRHCSCAPPTQCGSRAVQQNTAQARGHIDVGMDGAGEAAARDAEETGTDAHEHVPAAGG